MISPEIKARIKELQIYTRRLLSSSHVGDFRTAVKGSGFEFESLREYVPGDDIRFIDWQATARIGKPLVRQYYEEKSRTIMLLLDGSSSTGYGTKHSRFERMREIATVLATAALFTKDGVGLIIFSDDIDIHLSPTRVPGKITKLIEAMYEYKPSETTDFSRAFKKISSLAAKNTISFLISDFIGDNYKTHLMALAKRNDMIAIRCFDAAEQEFPASGVLEFQDPETGNYVTMDMRKRSTRNRKQFFSRWQAEVAALLRGTGIDLLDFEINKPYISELIRFFRRRMMYR